MTRRPRRPTPRDGEMLSIGALSRATEIPVETLRTWERRYGYPIPERKPSGHRVYALHTAARLRRIAQAIARGHRASDVVAASDDGLERLLVARGQQRPDGPGDGAALDLAALLSCVERFDGARLRRLLLREWRRLAPLAWLQTWVAPLVTGVGDAWAAGWLEVRHEHFLSEHVGGLLRTLRLPIEEGATGPAVVLATLPGEAHGLGLQMAALAFAVADCRTVYLGTETPPAELVSSARDLRAQAIALSISSHTGGKPALRAVAELRRKLPPRVWLVVGGSGAPAGTPAVTRLRSLAAIERFAARLGAAE